MEPVLEILYVKDHERLDFRGQSVQFMVFECDMDKKYCCLYLVDGRTGTDILMESSNDWDESHRIFEAISELYIDLEVMQSTHNAARTLKWHTLVCHYCCSR